jgi:flagellar hook-associated protein 2
MVDSITKTLGAGSGIDLTQLVTGLVEAQFAAKTATLTKREETVTAQLSGLAQLKSGITNFDRALKTLVSGGTLASKPTSSSEAVLKVTTTGSTVPTGLAQSVTVQQLASAQVSTTNTAVPASTVYRTGTLSLRFGSDVVDASGNVTGFTAAGSAINISITSADTTLAGIAAKINAADAGVTASIVEDAGGQRLSIRGESGAAQAFEISTSNQGGGGGTTLANLAVSRSSGVTTTATRARDAIVTVDGVRYSRTSNTISDLVPDVTLDLQSVSTTPVKLGLQRPTEAVSSAVQDFVAAYNELLALSKEASDPVTGPLRGEASVIDMMRGLRSLTTDELTTATVGPKTLAGLGVATARDGTLSVNSAQLSRALRETPAAVEAIFKDGAGLSKALGQIATRVTSRTFGFEAATQRYTKLKAQIEDAKLKVTDDTAAARTRLTQQFASMDSRVAAYKATQGFLDQQIAAWNNG